MGVIKIHSPQWYQRLQKYVIMPASNPFDCWCTNLCCCPLTFNTTLCCFGMNRFAQFLEPPRKERVYIKTFNQQPYRNPKACVAISIETHILIYLEISHLTNFTLFRTHIKMAVPIPETEFFKVFCHNFTF